MRETDEAALKASEDDRLFEKFVKTHKPFIKGCAAKFTHRYVTESDDEWSAALSAFSDAVKTYQPGSAGFFSYAELLIKRRLIDYRRIKMKYSAEIPADPSFFETEPGGEDDTPDAALRHMIIERTTDTPDDSLKYEIEAIGGELRRYGFAFHDLTGCSPRSEKTKEACKKAVLFILGDPGLLALIRTTKRLPMKIISESTRIPLKILEFYRRYIIAAAEILSGEYPCLAGYLSYIGKDGP